MEVDRQPLIKNRNINTTPFEGDFYAYKSANNSLQPVIKQEEGGVSYTKLKNLR